MPIRRLLAVAALPLAAVLALAGCSQDPADKGTGDKIVIVASTDVWGDIAAQIGGSAVIVTSLITDPNQDPHEFESSARDQLEVSEARIVVENGGGYDDFMSKLAEKAPKDATIVNVATLSGKNLHPADGDFNEHLWYDFPTVDRYARTLATELERLAPASRLGIASRLTQFEHTLGQDEQQEAAIKAAHAGEGVAITEPVPLYATTAMGLVDRTPKAFSSAIEEGTDVSPIVLQEELDLFSQKRVAVLAYNEQTVTTTTQKVLAAAKAAGIPTVGVRETLPNDTHYLDWMHDDLARFAAALG